MTSSLCGDPGLGKLFIINANPVFARGWKLVAKLLDKRTKDKINILPGPDAYVPALRAAIGDAQLSREYGGQGRAKVDKDGLYDPITEQRRRSSNYST